MTTSLRPWNPAALAVPSAEIWARDFALVGGFSSLLAPLVVLSFGAVAVPYLVTATAMGTVTGALLGYVTRRGLNGRLRRLPKIAWLPLGAALGGLWGLVVGFTAGFVAGVATQAGLDLALFMGLFSATAAAVVGVLQLGWFWLAYAFLRVRRRSVRGAMALSLAVPLVPASLFLLTFVLGHRSLLR